MKNTIIFIFSIIIFSYNTTIYCVNEEDRKHKSETATAVSEIVAHAIENNVYSQCDEKKCSKVIHLNEACLEWTKFQDTIFNINFCDDACFDKAKEKHTFLDRGNFKVVTPDHVEINVAIVLKAIAFSILHPSVILNSPIETANKISNLINKPNKNLFERLYLYEFDHFCRT